MTLRGQVRWGRGSKEGTGVCSLATGWVAGTHRQGLRVMPGPSISPGGNFVKLRMLHCHLLEKCDTIYLNPRRLQGEWRLLESSSHSLNLCQRQPCPT